MIYPLLVFIVRDGFFTDDILYNMIYNIIIVSMNKMNKIKLMK